LPACPAASTLRLSALKKVRSASPPCGSDTRQRSGSVSHASRHERRHAARARTARGRARAERCARVLLHGAPQQT
jgi:hypothetical protein